MFVEKKNDRISSRQGAVCPIMGIPLYYLQELRVLHAELEIAYKSQCDAVITTWRKGKKFTYIGKITAFDSILNLISIEGPFGDENIPVVDIVKVQRMY